MVPRVPIKRDEGEAKCEFMSKPEHVLERKLAVLIEEEEIEEEQVSPVPRKCVSLYRKRKRKHQNGSVCASRKTS